MRDSPSLVILPALQGEGARVRAFDPEGMTEARKLLPDIEWCQDAYHCLEGADAAVILTEWNEFRGLDLDRAREVMRAPALIDLRNIYDPAQVAAAGFSYASIGRPAAVAASE
jgi:UDPglucose 6-dehydrogenase